MRLPREQQCPHRPGSVIFSVKSNRIIIIIILIIIVTVVVVVVVVVTATGIIVVSCISISITCQCRMCSKYGGGNAAIAVCCLEMPCKC